MFPASMHLRKVITKLINPERLTQVYVENDLGDTVLVVRTSALDFRLIIEKGNEIVPIHLALC